MRPIFFRIVSVFLINNTECANWVGTAAVNSQFKSRKGCQPKQICRCSSCSASSFSYGRLLLLVIAAPLDNDCVGLIKPSSILDPIILIIFSFFYKCSCYPYLFGRAQQQVWALRLRHYLMFIVYIGKAACAGHTENCAILWLIRQVLTELSIAFDCARLDKGPHRCECEFDFGEKLYGWLWYLNALVVNHQGTEIFVNRIVESLTGQTQLTKLHLLSFV